MVLNGNGIPAGSAGESHKLQTLKFATSALPVTDRIVHKIDAAGFSEIGKGKDGLENRLQTQRFPLLWKKVHLEKLVIALLLNLNEVRYRNVGLNVCKVYSFDGFAHEGLLQLVSEDTNPMDNSKADDPWD